MAYTRPRNGSRPDQFLEQQNNDLTQSLANKVSSLKRITIAIGDDVREQNRLLSDMDSDFLKSNSLLGSTMKKLGIVSRSGGNKLLLYLVLFALFVFFVIYTLMKR
uniref:t-SNARE coiled-coil homology domain-containing protein n=1 Tax=Parastrongyloides trichosuri TaxID=131310 RepID=A0A0N4ZID8_PARTI